MMKQYIGFIFTFLLVVGVGPPIHAAQHTIYFTSQEKKIVETYVVDLGEWIDRMTASLISNKRRDLIRDEVDRSEVDGSAIPSTGNTIVQKALGRPDYKTKKDQLKELSNIGERSP